MKKVALITGCTGFVGSHLAKRLVKEGYDVHCIVRKTSNLDRILEIKKFVTIHKVDLTESEKLKLLAKKINPNYIFHTASVGIHGGIEAEAKQNIETILMGTINLVTALADNRYELFVNTGTSSEYGIKDKPMQESDTCNPESIYAISKLASTQFCSQYARSHNKSIVTLRIFSPYGPSDNPDRFISYITDKIIQKQNLIIENPDAVRDYIYIDDLVNAYISCIKNKSKLKGEIINIGSGTQSSIQDVINVLKNELKCNFELNVMRNKRNYEPKNWVANITKARNLLGWKPLTSLKDGLKYTLDQKC